MRHPNRLFALVAVVCASHSLVAHAQDVLRYKFQPGDKLPYALEQKMSMNMMAAGNAINMDMTQLMDMTWNIKSVDKEGKAKMSQTFDRVRLTMNTANGKMEFDSKEAKAPEAPGGAAIAELYKALVGAEITFTMDPRGQISDVNIPTKLTEAMKNSPAAAGAGDMFTAEGMKRMINQSGLTLPEKAATKGESWDTTAEIKALFGKMQVVKHVTYDGSTTREGVKAAEFQIKPKVTIESDPNAQISATLKSQDTNGKAYFDLTTGRLLECNVSQTMELELKAMGQVIEQKINQTVKMTLTGKDKGK
jgi:hypothetical protein